MRIKPTYRVADLDNAEGKNLMPWVRDAEDFVAAAVAGRRGRRSLLWQAAVEIAAVIAERVAQTNVPAAAEHATAGAVGER